MWKIWLIQWRVLVAVRQHIIQQYQIRYGNTFQYRFVNMLMTNIFSERSEHGRKYQIYPIIYRIFQPYNSPGKKDLIHIAWWRHQMETFSTLLAICAGNSPVPGEFPTQRPVTRSFDVYFDLRPNKRLSKQWWGWWFETPSRPLWRHRNGQHLYEKWYR